MCVEFNYDNAILAFIDILGYTELIKTKSAEGIYNLIYEALSIKHSVATNPNHPAQPYADAIKVQVLSDSLIMFIDATSLETTGCNFLPYLCEFCLKFIGNTGLLLRGGIASGSYFQKQLTSPKNQFIFSKALVAAYQLEQKANYPRILLSDEFFGLGKVFEDYSTTDFDGVRFLDIYKDSKNYPPSYKKELFMKIHASLNKGGVQDKRILAKQFYFKQYHNKRMQEIGKQDMNEFIFDLEG